VDHVSVSADEGEMLVLLGESGSGKTTLLRCIAGLEKADAGEIHIGGRLVFSSRTGKNEPTRSRQLGMIFQGYALWPHMTVQENVGYPLAVRKIPPSERGKRTNEYLDLVGCGHLAARYPHELSGGQQQRIALARALAYEPTLVLFDEPLSNLDAGLRDELRLQIRELKRRLKFTGVYVTHDQTEAFLLADKVAILARGRLLQTGSPKQVYSNPIRLEVARFLGCTNALEGEAAQDAGRWWLRSPELTDLDISQAVWPAPPEHGRVTICARPDATLITRAELSATAGRLCGELRDVVDLGGQVEYLIRLKSGRLWRSRVEATGDGLRIGDTVEIEIKTGNLFAYAPDGVVD